MTYRNIMAIADPEREGSWGLQRAGQLARDSGATLHLRGFSHHAGISALQRVSAEVSDLARKELLRQQQAWLEREADTLRTTVKDVRAQAVWGSPVHERIAEEILELEPDLVVKDVENLPGLKRLFFTPLDWHLLRLCPAPLLLVNRSPKQPPRKVAAAVDVGADFEDAARLNDAVLAAARDLASLSKASVEVVHVFEGLPPALAGAVDGAMAAPQATYAKLREGRREQFDAFARRGKVEEAHRHLLDGDPDLALTGFAQDKGIDVVVMGSVNRTGLERILVGSTAERILTQLESDVLVLKPHGFADEVRKQLGSGK